MRLGDLPEQGEWVKLADEPPCELAFGVIGRFWGGETVWKTIDAARVRRLRRARVREDRLQRVAAPLRDRADAGLLRGADAGARRRLARALPPLLARRAPRRGDRHARVPAKPSPRRCADARRPSGPSVRPRAPSASCSARRSLLDAAAGAARRDRAPRAAPAPPAVARRRARERARRRLPRRRPAADAALGRELRGAAQAAPRRRARARSPRSSPRAR